ATRGAEGSRRRGEGEYARGERPGHSGRRGAEKLAAVPPGEVADAARLVVDVRLVAVVARARVAVEVEPEVEETLGRERLEVRDRHPHRQQPVGLGDLDAGDVGRLVMVPDRV